MFRHLCESHPTETPELVTTHRMTDPADRAAAEAMREGRIAEALSHLAEAGHLHVVDDDLSLYVGMLRRWWEARSEGHPHPMVDRRHRTRHQLNRLARCLLAADGQLGSDEIEASGGRGFAVGDEVVARMAARHLHPPGQPSAYVRNGAVGTVTAVIRGVAPAGDRLRIEFAGAGTIDVPRGVLRRTRRTGRSARTSASTTPTPSPATPSRAPRTTAPPAGSTRAPAAPRRTSTSPVGGGRITCSSPGASTRSTASTSPRPRPHRWSRASVRASRNRDRNEPRWRSILPQRDPVNMTGPPRSLVVGHTELQHTRFQKTSFVDCPLRSASPFMSFDIGKGPIQAVAGYRARWHPQPGGGAWEWAIGRPAPVQAALGHRQAAVAALTRYAVARAAEELRAHGCERLPPWAASHVALAAARGVESPDWAALADLYERVARYRASVGASDETNEPEYPLANVLGPEPSEVAEAMTRRSLAIELESAARPIHSPSLRRS